MRTGTCLAADGHLVAERHDVVRKVLVKQREFAHHVVDGASVELLVASAKLRNRNLAVRHALTRRDQLVEFHQAGFLGLGTHAC
jgi:hypothetical protein